MNNMINEKIQTSLEYLADLCLENNGIKTDYTDEDLFHATTIFMEVFWNKQYEFQSKKLTYPQLEVLATETGKNIRQMISLATGKDMHEVVKNLMNNYEKSKK